MYCSKEIKMKPYRIGILPLDNRSLLLKKKIWIGSAFKPLLRFKSKKMKECGQLIMQFKNAKYKRPALIIIIYSPHCIAIIKGIKPLVIISIVHITEADLIVIRDLLSGKDNKERRAKKTNLISIKWTMNKY